MLLRDIPAYTFLALRVLLLTATLLRMSYQAYPQEPMAPPVSPAYTRQPRRAPRPGRRLPFWLYVAFHVLMVLVLIGAGAQQSFDTTFDILGIWAAADVIMAIGCRLWKATGPEERS